MINIAKKTKQENNTIEKKQFWNQMIQGLATGFLFCVVVLLAFIAFSKIEIETEGWCNSGNIKLDIEAENIVQNTTCMDSYFNETTKQYEIRPDPDRINVSCFKQDTILSHAKLKGIEGLNCQGSAKIKMPLIMSWFMGDGY